MTIHPRKITPFRITEDELSADAESCAHCGTPIWKVDGYKLDGEGVCQTCRDIENDYHDLYYEDLIRSLEPEPSLEFTSEEIREMQAEEARQTELDADFR